MGTRKNYRSLTALERDRFVQALFHVKSTGVIDQFAQIRFLGQFNSAWGLNRALGAGGPLPTQQQVEANQGRDDYDTFWRDLENAIHNRPHVWVGGVMGGVASPGDPVFYLHHCWIDLRWARWRRDHPDAPFVSGGPGVGLNDPLMEWQGGAGPDPVRRDTCLRDQAHRPGMGRGRSASWWRYDLVELAGPVGAVVGPVRRCDGCSC